MNIHNLKLPSLFLAAAIMVCGCVMTGAAQTSAFTYQGRFTDSTVAQPTSGVYDMQFTLFDAASGGNQVGVPVVVPGVQVVNGIFTVSLDYPAAFFDGTARFLQVTIGNTVLNPRQEITSAPFAIMARKSLLAIDSNKLGGIDADQYVTGQVVRSVNNLTGNVTLAAGNNITITPNGSTLTIASTGAGGSGINNQTNLQTSANFNIDGTGAAKIFNAGVQFNLGGNRFLSGGNENVFAGDSAGASNTTGGDNAFVGTRAGLVNATGFNNSFFGADAGRSNTADNNSFFGRSAGYDNAGGALNSFFGVDAGRFNQTGAANSFVGRAAGRNNLTGGANSFFGNFAGAANTTGGNNTAIGNAADFAANNLTFATAVGAGSVAPVSNTIALGRSDGSDTVRVFGLGAGGTTALCRNASNQISTCAASGGTGSENFIQNQNSAVQSAGFNIGGSGTVGGFLSGAVVSTETFYRIGTQIILSTPNATSVAVGQSVGFNATGANNSFFGAESGKANTSGARNSYFGFQSGQTGATTNDNAFFGYQAGKVNTGTSNTFVGSLAGDSNTSGGNNTFVGYGSGSSGSGNTSVGSSAGGNGDENTVVGAGAGGTGNGNTIVGKGAGGNGDLNTTVGYHATVAPTSASFPNPKHSTAIGAGAVANYSNSIVLGTSADDVSVPGNLYVSKNAAAAFMSTSELTVTGGKLKLTGLQNFTTTGNHSLCINGNSFVSLCPNDTQSSSKLTVEPENQSARIELQAAQIKAQQSIIERQAEQFQQQQTQIEALKQTVCSMNPAAKICGK